MCRMLFALSSESSAAPAFVRMDESKGEVARAGVLANCKTRPLSLRSLEMTAGQVLCLIAVIRHSKLTLAKGLQMSKGTVRLWEVS